MLKEETTPQLDVLLAPQEGRLTLRAPDGAEVVVRLADLIRGADLPPGGGPALLFTLILQLHELGRGIALQTEATARLAQLVHGGQARAAAVAEKQADPLAVMERVFDFFVARGIPVPGAAAARGHVAVKPAAARRPNGADSE